MSDMFSISIVAILVSGIIGLVREYGGVEWLVGAISSKIKSRRGAEYGIGLKMCIRDRINTAVEMIQLL